MWFFKLSFFFKERDHLFVIVKFKSQRYFIMTNILILYSFGVLLGSKLEILLHLIKEIFIFHMVNPWIISIN